MSIALQQIEVLRRLAANALKMEQPEKAAVHFEEAITAFVTDPGSVGAPFGGMLASDYCAFSLAHPSLTPAETVLSLLDTFCDLGAREKADPNWMMQFFVMRAVRAVDIAPDETLRTLEGAVQYYRQNPTIDHNAVIADLYIRYADQLFSAGRYEEVEKVLSEGLAETKSRTGT